MPLFLPYGGATPISVDNGLFLASWVRWCELHARSSGRPNDSWDRQLMPDYGSNVTMVTRLAGDERYVWSVDILCRILAHYRDRRQTGLDFGQQNVALLEQTSTIGFTGRTIQAYRLTEEAKSYWNDLPPDQKEIYSTQFDALLEGLSEGDALEDPHHINVQMPTVCPTIEPVETAPTTKLECGGRPIDLIRRMVSDIQNEPFQPHYRKRRQGLPVRGWDQRLQSYFWPKPSSNWVIVCLEVDRILEDGYQIVKAVRNRAWTTEQKQQAKDWAHRVFKWGGVPQRDVTWETVWVVIQAALSGNEAATAPMKQWLDQSSGVRLGDRQNA